MFGRIIIILSLLSTLTFAKYFSDSPNSNEKYCANKLLCGKNTYIDKPNDFDNKLKFKPNQKALCDACDVAIPVVQKLVRENKTEHFHSVAKFFCIEFKVEDPVVCDLVVREYENVALSVIRDSKLEASDYCDVGLGCGTSNNPLLNWNITLPNIPKPPVVPPTPPQPGSPTLRILHLTDIHIDFEYQPGAIADCLDPLCCRNQSTPNPNSTATRAGSWGDYRNCDIPFWTVQTMFDYISKNEKFDFIYWTGDLPPHNVWNQTRTDQLKALSALSDLFIRYFPNKVIYPTLGNHEAAPCNVFPPNYVTEDNIDWLYSALATNWTATGLPNSLVPDIRSGAFYTLLLYPGVRLVSLNMNYCAALNFWVFINTTDPLGQLEWLANVLQYSEDHNEKVHIIGHINPNGCLGSWSSNYYKIVNRYENTITGQFFGHTHNDEIELFYDLNNITRATNIAFIAPSVTTFSYMNPGYRIYTVDGFYANTSWRVLDHQTSYLNLTEANQSGQYPEWQLEYTAKSTYGLSNLFPQDWSDLVDYLLNHLDDPRIDLLHKYRYKSSDDIGNCNRDCKINLLCEWKQANSAITIPCNHQ